MSDYPPTNDRGECSVCRFKQPDADHAFHHELCRYVHWSVETIKKLTERVRKLEAER
jgi:hypothetical protein